MKKKRLKLSSLESITHYSMVAFILLFGSFLLIEGLLYGFEDETRPDWNQFPTFKFATGLIILGLWGFYKQYRRLFFKSILIENLFKDEVFTISKKIFNDYSWWIVKEKGNILEAEGKSFRNNSFDIRTYRNRITLLYEEGNLLINCIVEPPRNGQFITFGKMNQIYEDFEYLFLDGIYYLEADKSKI